jgi:DNA-binding protein HU-beta
LSSFLLYCRFAAIPGFSEGILEFWLEFAAGSTTSSLMAKPLTKSQTVATIAEAVGITKKQASSCLEVLTDLAYKQAKHSFTLPGIGKLVLATRPARTMTMAFGPKKGQTIKVPAKRVVKFRVSKAAKDAILGAK